jgi:exodeoxyribonuclease VII large subunit
MQHHLENGQSRLESIRRAEMFRTPVTVVRRKEQQVDELTGRLGHALHKSLGRAQRQVAELQIRLAGVRPAVLVRDHQARVTRLDHRLQAVVQRRWREAERRIDTLLRVMLGSSPVGQLSTEAEKLRQYEQRLHRGTAQRLAFVRASVEATAGRLEATSYRRTLARGFSVTWNEQRDQIIRSPADAPAGQTIITETAEGDFRSRVE